MKILICDLRPHIYLSANKAWVSQFDLVFSLSKVIKVKFGQDN